MTSKMSKSTLIELLRCFDNGELKRFESFVRSPYHNSVANLVRFCTELMRFAPDFQSAELGQVELWKKMFPGKNFNYGIMKNLIHGLTKLAWKFIETEEFNRNESTKSQMVIQALRMRNNEKLYTQKAKEIEKLLMNNSSKIDNRDSMDNYSTLGQLYLSNTYFYKINNLKLPDANTYQKAMSYIIFSYVINLIKQYNNLVAVSFERNYEQADNVLPLLIKELNKGFLDKLPDFAGSLSEKDRNILETYVALSRSQIYLGDFTAYESFRNRLISNSNLFSRFELKMLFNCLSTNISHLDNKQHDVSKMFVSNFELMDELDLLAENGKLGAMYYYYFLTAAFRAQDFEKIDFFSDKYLDSLGNENLGNARSFTLALQHFGGGRFDHALSEISKIDYPSLFMKFFVREFKACCLYELDEKLLFENELKNLNQFLLNNKIDNPRLTDSIRMHMDNVKGLFRIRDNPDKDKLADFLSGVVLRRKWVECKLNELNSALTNSTVDRALS